MTHPQGAPGWAPTPDGRTLFYQELPGPGPTVVFEAGAASTRSIWGLVQPALARVARTVVYDRAGLGRSESADNPRRLPDLAADLNALLDHLEQTAAADIGSTGFVLVGHSWGGPIVRLAAIRRPERIDGLVLVDPADEDCDVYYSAVTRRSNRIQNTLFPPLARAGLLRRIYGLTVNAYPPEVRADARREMYTPTAVATQIAESARMTEDLSALRAQARESPELPVTVISGAKSGGLGNDTRRQLNAAHRSRAARSRDGRHVVAERSGHLVMISQPELIAEETTALLRRF